MALLHASFKVAASLLNEPERSCSLALDEVSTVIFVCILRVHQWIISMPYACPCANLVKSPKAVPGRSTRRSNASTYPLRVDLNIDLAASSCGDEGVS